MRTRRTGPACMRTMHILILAKAMVYKKQVYHKESSKFVNQYFMMIVLALLDLDSVVDNSSSILY